MKDIEVVWRGPIGRASGLGIASRAYVHALRRQGLTTRVETKRSRSNVKGESHKYRILIYHYPPNLIDIEKERKVFDRIILNTVWETTRIPESWLRNINKFDAICVPSLHNKRAMTNSGVTVPIFLVPHGVDTDKFTPKNKGFTMPRRKGAFVFVSIFGFQHRKNPEALLRAYWEEFSSADNVLMVIKTNGYAAFENDAWIRNRILTYKKKLGLRKKTAPVIILSRHLSPERMRGIYTLGNAFVLPTRGEGVGLPFLESLASGLPVIATGWGGQMDFLTNKNAFLVNYELKHPTRGMNPRDAIARSFRYLFADKGQRWAEPDLQSLKRQMRVAFEHPQLCKRKGQQGRKDAHKYSWDRAGRKFHQAIVTVVKKKSVYP
ncbi:MAG: glycosyltransferase family 4 protein [Gorillibacterium sp.]|nr:glycosyltransferase family 4 protein [Gorillibacterium sp.]